MLHIYREGPIRVKTATVRLSCPRGGPVLRVFQQALCGVIECGERGEGLSCVPAWLRVDRRALLHSVTASIADIARRGVRWQRKGVRHDRCRAPVPEVGSAHPSPLSIGRRALAAARRAMELAPEAACRRKAGRKATEGGGKTSDLAAAEQGVSPRTVDQAKVIVRRGTQALIEAVEQGGVSVALGAARLARRVPTGKPRPCGG